jgi:hypothetical protein
MSESMAALLEEYKYTKARIKLALETAGISVPPAATLIELIELAQEYKIDY